MKIAPDADRRIRRIAGRVGVVGGGIALATALVVVPRISLGPDPAQEPWERDRPVDATWARDPLRMVWEAEGSARLSLPAALADRPLALQLREAVPDMVLAYLGDQEPAHRPHFLGSVHAGEELPFVAYPGSVLWITSQHPWRIEVTLIDPPELEHAVSGTTNAVFVHRGPATSGTFTWGPGGSFSVVARTVEGYESLVASADEPDGRTGGTKRISWAASSLVVIEVLVFSEVEWEFRLDVPENPEVAEDPEGEAEDEEGAS